MISNYIASNLTSQQPICQLGKKKIKKRVAPLRYLKNKVRSFLGSFVHEVTGTITFALRIDVVPKEADHREDNGILDSNTLESVKESKPFVFIEIERCKELRPLNIFGKPCCPFVLVKCNGVEVARTFPLKPTKNPIWQDECYKIPFPAEHDTAEHIFSFEIWNYDVRNEQKVGPCIGVTSLKIIRSAREMFGGTEVKVFEEKLYAYYCADCLKTYSYVDGELQEQVNSVQVGPSRLTRKLSFRRTSYLVGANNVLKQPDKTSSLGNLYKISNPEPFRRRSCLNDMTDPPESSFSESTLLRAFLLVICYLLIGVLAFSYMFESWSTRDSLYFCVVTFTTVGYGDVRPRSDGAKLFSCVYALGGIGIIGIALGYIGQNIVHARMMAMHGVEKKAIPTSNEEKCVEENDDMSDIEAISSCSGTIRSASCHHAIKESFPKNTGRINSLARIESTLRTFLVPENGPSAFREAFVVIVPILSMILTGSLVVGKIEGWTAIDSIYWCISTGTSVGYGDFAPETDEMRWFSVFFIPLSVGVISAALGKVANVFVEREISKTNEKLLKSELTVEDLERMNVDGDGEVSLLEFVEFMLKSMSKVDQKMLDELHDQFYRLDADGSGALQEDDLVLLAEEKLNEQRKIALERFEKKKLGIG